MPDETPPPIRKAVRCAICQLETPHNVRAHASSIQDDVVELSGRTYELHNYIDAQIVECVVCKSLVMVRREVFSETPEDEAVLVLPSAAPRRTPSWKARLPEEPERLLCEVYGSWALGHRSVAAMGARALIDYVIRRRVRRRCGFAAGLRALVEKTLLSTRHAKQVERALESGHAAVHRGHCPSDEQLSSLMAIVENLLESELILDAEAKHLRTTTPRDPRRRSRGSKPRKTPRSTGLK